eukprot:CAMPEP_0194046544 /NCGR_PEP_ID=MMETSP0009_2-20130614/21550_1 /TAXON_ID=210454 /ORGANISM="Grammatophora oceanica, Strain CCMP 410" /LENGTH=116 /DNA_ID=CAMNT_0038691875 /DNA_START=32 /DNA_END=382 /DNA_ORIENTATION=+
MTSLVRMYADKAMGVVANFYRKALAAELQQYGLRYEDVLNDDIPEVAEALKYAPEDVKTARNRRLKRAIDLDFKKKIYTDYAPDVEQETFKLEFYDEVQKIKARNEEFIMLNSHKK